MRRVDLMLWGEAASYALGGSLKHDRCLALAARAVSGARWDVAERLARGCLGVEPGRLLAPGLAEAVLALGGSGGHDFKCERLTRAARRYVRRAAELLKAGDLPDAAERAWAAVRSATTALALRTRGTPSKPEGMAWREFVKDVLVRAGLGEGEASRWAAYSIDARDRLHGACFYGLQCKEPEHRPLIERAGEYVSLVERLLRRWPAA
jgi:plasmid stabilization system protein ParE